MRRILVACWLLLVSSADAASDDAAALEAQADTAYTAKDFAKAVDLYARALALQPASRLAYNGACSAARAGQRDRALELLERSVALAEPAGSTSPWFLSDPDLETVRQDPRFTRLVEEARAGVERYRRANVGTTLAPTTVKAAGMDKAALDQLVAEAGKRHTSALVVLADGKLVGEWYFGAWTRRIEAMSATKAVVALAIGLLVDDGKLTLDAPLYTIYPELKQGRKQKLTLRHLLNHTSGIAADRMTTAVYASPDFVQFALASDMNGEPGEAFFYNNEAVNLLAGVVERVSGKKLDVFLRERLFGPLEITDVTWSHDRAGNPHAMAGLQIHPLDFAKIGQLVLDEGLWRGRRILSAEWIRTATRTPGQRFEPTSALLWWLSYAKTFFTVPTGWAREAAAKGIDAAVAEKLVPLEGHRFTRPEFLAALSKAAPNERDRTALIARLQEVALFPARSAEGPVLATSAQGYGGQYVVVVPGTHIVAVRMSIVNDEPGEQQSFLDFDQMVLRLKATPDPGRHGPKR